MSAEALSNGLLYAFTASSFPACSQCALSLNASLQDAMHDFAALLACVRCLEFKEQPRSSCQAFQTMYQYVAISRLIKAESKRC